jgi:hypothetical protein
MKKKLLIATLCLLFSCSGRFSELPEEGVSYQVIRSGNDFVKAINGNGAPSIQLLDKNFNVKQSETIAGGYLISIFDCKTGDIEIAHNMSKSDTASFFAWKRQYKYGPASIGNHSIKYTFKINNGFFKENEYHIDAFAIRRDNFTVDFSFKKESVANVPISAITISADGFTFIDFDKRIIKAFNALNKELVTLFLNDIENKGFTK